MNQETIIKQEEKLLFNEENNDPYYADELARLMVQEGLIFAEEEKEIANMIRGCA